MSGNAQKTPLAQSLNRFAEKKALDAIQLTGKALPCRVTGVSGSIVTVEFLVTSEFTLSSVTVPSVGSEYVRLPLQIGCLGVVFPADAYIGGVSGLGGGAADLSIPANLSALVFFPIGNKNWSVPDDPNAVVIYGPDGAIIRTLSKSSVLTIAELEIRLKATSIVFEGPVTFLDQVSGDAGNVIDFGTTELKAGDIKSNSVDVGSTHTHSGVMPGGGTSGPPTP